jgi:hypothetical protein
MGDETPPRPSASAAVLRRDGGEERLTTNLMVRTRALCGYAFKDLTLNTIFAALSRRRHVESQGVAPGQHETVFRSCSE